ncbi:hypothetical protein C2G38_2170983 [Gigaspora rosea]|uniref:Uncharacterized protein n=1 Tax=Gigaspora rosea TaxID=44941 RepID=A0A397VM15_9GLOM|nr:hypothetical protein C2G38_2170983 [Gigaspora rosea]
MSKPSKEDKSVKTRGSKGKGISANEDIDEDENNDSWDSNNETVEERVTALVGKKKKEIFQGQKALDEAWEAWLEKVSSFKQGIKLSPQQNQDNSKNSTSKLAISILKDEEETETIRGLQIRILEYLILRNIEAILKFRETLNSRITIFLPMLQKSVTPIVTMFAGAHTQEGEYVIVKILTCDLNAN